MADASKATPGLPEAYQKSRKLYGLLAALLLSWEVAKIEIRELPTVAGMKIEVTNKSSIPWILLALLTYAAYRHVSEWLHCHHEQRSYRASQVDFLVSHAIGSLASAYFLVQALLDWNLYQRIAQTGVGFLAVVPGAMALGAGLGLSTARKSDPKWKRNTKLVACVLATPIFLTASFLKFLEWTQPSARYELTITLAWLALGVLCVYGAAWWQIKRGYDFKDWD